MSGNISRINGQKGGRPKGSENSDTQQRREMKNRWLQRVHEVADPIFNAHLDLALGHYTETVTPEGVQRVYKRPPDARSLQWIMEQVWGRSVDSTGLQDIPEVADNSIMTEELQRSIDWAVRCALPRRRIHPRHKVN